MSEPNIEKPQLVSVHSPRRRGLLRFSNGKRMTVERVER